MRTLHRQLDSAGVKLLCNGFRYDVRGSAMSRTPMGTRAYRLNPHKQHLTGADLVYIFDPTDDADAIVTVEEQEAYFKKYLDEAGIARPPGL